MIQESHPWVGYVQKNWTQALKRYSSTRVHNDITHNNLKVEATQLSISGGMNK